MTDSKLVALPEEIISLFVLEATPPAAGVANNVDVLNPLGKISITNRQLAKLAEKSWRFLASVAYDQEYLNKLTQDTRSKQIGFYRNFYLNSTDGSDLLTVEPNVPLIGCSLLLSLFII